MVANGEQTMEQVINKVATYTKKAQSDDFFRRHGLTKVIEERPKTENKPQRNGKKKVDMSADRKKALNKLQGAKV
jgi:hypothetical protein